MRFTNDYFALGEGGGGVGAHFLHSSGGRLHHYMTTLACLAGGQSFVHLGESCYLFIYLSFFLGGGGGVLYYGFTTPRSMQAATQAMLTSDHNSLIPLEFRH